MNLRITSTIISREYLSRVKKKSFLVTTFLAPIFFAAMCILPTVIMNFSEDKGQVVAVRDCSGIVMPYMVSSDAITFREFPGLSLEDFKTLAADDYTCALNISEYDESTKSVTAVIYSTQPVGMSTKDIISRNVNDAIEAYRLEQYDIKDLKTIMQEVQANVDVQTITIGKNGSEVETESMVYMILSMVLAMIIYMFITLFSSMVMRGVIEEKASKIVEVLVSSVKATELMFGKIIGVALVALTQFLLWVLLTGIFVGVYTTISGIDATEMAVTQTAGLEATEILAQGSTNTFLTTLASLPFGQIVVCFILYFFFGFLLYASLFAAIGSAVENEADTNQLQLPVTVPLMLGFFIAIYSFNAPNSAIVMWGSHIPFTSPIVMLARLPYGVPVWELVLSIGLLAVTFVACAYLSAKIYKVGILMSGKKSTFKDLWNWLRMKQ